MPAPVTETEQILWANYPEVWQFLYLAQNYETATETDATRMIRESRIQMTSPDGLSSYRNRQVRNWISYNNWTPPRVPASTYMAGNVPNGVYTYWPPLFPAGTNEICTREESQHFTIYTIQAGRYAGKRVIKRYNPSSRFSSNYEAVAFLNADATPTLWRRFAGNNRIDFLNPFVAGVAEGFGTRRSTSDFERNGAVITLRHFNCVVCNARLDNDREIRRGHCFDHFLTNNNDEEPATFDYGDEGEVYEAEQVDPTAHLARCEVTGDVIQ